MTNAWRKWLVLGSVLLAGTTACGSDGPTTEVVPPGVDLSGLNFQLSGATITLVSGALPTADASFVAPIVSVDRAPTITLPATITVRAAEPFQTILLQPGGASSYVRILLPAQTNLIAVSVKTDATSSGVVATAATIAVGSGTRTSRASPLSFQTFGN